MKQVSTVLKPYFDLPSKPFSSHFSHLSGGGEAEFGDSLMPFCHFPGSSCSQDLDLIPGCV
jgi:hypothetical protein